MKEKLFKTGLKKTDLAIRRTAITCTALTFISAAILIPLTLSMTLNQTKPVVQNRDSGYLVQPVQSFDIYFE